MIKFSFALILLALKIFASEIVYSSTEPATDQVSHCAPFQLRIASTFLTHLTSSFKIEDEESLKVQEKLLNFNKSINFILKTQNPEQETIPSSFKEQASALNGEFEKISSREDIFGPCARQIAGNIKGAVAEFIDECSAIESFQSLKEKLESLLPKLASSEFFELYKDITERNSKCSDCGYGYFKPHKLFSKKTVLECRLCHLVKPETSIITELRITEMSPVEEVTELLSKISLGKPYKSDYSPEKFKILLGTLQEKKYTKKQIVKMAGYSSYNPQRDLNNMLSLSCKDPEQRWSNIQLALFSGESVTP